MFIYLPPPSRSPKFPWRNYFTITRHYHTRRSCLILFFFVALRSNAGYGLLIYNVSRSLHNDAPPSVDSSGRVISWSQRHLPDNTQHSEARDINAPGGIWTHNLSRRAAADLRLWPRGNGTGILPYFKVINYLVWLLFRGRGTKARTPKKKKFIFSIQ